MRSLTSHGVKVDKNGLVTGFSQKRKLNWRPDLPDFRDHMFEPQGGAIIPPHYSLRPFASPIQDQGDLGSCTGNAFASMIELNDRRKMQVDVSRLFVYFNERVYYGEEMEDNGAYIRDGIKALAQWGWASEKTWPYNLKKWNKKPFPSAYKEAAKRKIQEYQRIVGLSNMKACIAGGFPFVFGFTVYESFMSAKVASNGIVPMPKPSESDVGGHAVLAVGYDDALQRFEVQNSWGEEWGDNGYFSMPYEYIGNDNLADDMWTIRK